MAFKPAPFAEKKNAKSAAPENSILDLIELRCGADGFATRQEAATHKAAQGHTPGIRNVKRAGGTPALRKPGVGRPAHVKSRRGRN
jgi:hypothetical protein